MINNNRQLVVLSCCQWSSLAASGQWSLTAKQNRPLQAVYSTVRGSQARSYPEFEDIWISEEEDAMARDAGEINDGDLVENGHADDDIEGDKYAFQILLNIRAYGEAWLAKSSFGFHVFVHAL